MFMKIKWEVGHLELSLRLVIRLLLNKSQLSEYFKIKNTKIGIFICIKIAGNIKDN